VKKNERTRGMINKLIDMFNLFLFIIVLTIGFFTDDVILMMYAIGFILGLIFLKIWTITDILKYGHLWIK